jgi:hypothetical protein
MNLTSADIARMRDTEIISTLEQLEQEQARLDAHKIHALARLHQLRQGKRHGHGKYVGDEVAAALHWSPTTATNKVNTAVSLVRRLPDTVAALERGELDLPKVHAIHEWTAPLSRHHARQVAAVVNDWAPERTVSAVRAKLSREVHKIDPQGAEARKRERVKSRRVSYLPLPDGMAMLSIYDTAERIRAIYQLLDQMARQAKAAGDNRSLDELRADAWFNLVAGPNGERIKIELRITVPASVLAGLSNHPAHLHGYGPITTNTLWELAGRTSFWRRVITDPATGTVMEVSRRQPPGSLREYLATRTPTCVGVGCNRPAETCQVDHTHDYAHGGPTAEANLAPACAHHNLIKQEGGWRLEQPAPGHFLWTSPTGHQYEVLPEPVVEPTPDPPTVEEPPPF